jgi:hypothetical protein
MFASKSVLEHLARGIVGFGALAAAIVLARASGWGPAAGSTALALFALIALRGCPVCWTIGMVETVSRRLKPQTD